MIKDLPEVVAFLKSATARGKMVWHRNKEDVLNDCYQVAHAEGESWFEKRFSEAVIGLRGGEKKVICLILVNKDGQCHHCDATGIYEKLISGFFSFIKSKGIFAKFCEECRMQPAEYREQWI